MNSPDVSASICTSPFYLIPYKNIIKFYITSFRLKPVILREQSAMKNGCMAQHSGFNIPQSGRV
jgi:hypothetical protein